MVTSQNFSRVFFLVGQTVFICVNMANITTQLFFSVCLYAIITAENVTCTMNISLHFGFKCPLVMQVYGYSPVCVRSCIFLVVKTSIYLRKYWTTCIN